MTISLDPSATPATKKSKGSTPGEDSEKDDDDDDDDFSLDESPAKKKSTGSSVTEFEDLPALDKILLVM